MNSELPRNIFEPIEQYQKVYKKAIELFNLFEDSKPNELLRHNESLSDEVDKLINVSELDWSKCKNLGRHLKFLSHYLSSGDKKSCLADIRDILIYDLPEVFRNLIIKSNPESHLDQKLRDGVLPLVREGHYDSAIRKAFIILTESLRRSFGIDKDKDGEELVNLVFGKGGKIPVNLDESKKQAYRNLIAGFYVVYRNKFAHNNAVASLSEVNAIIEMINNLIIEINSISMPNKCANV